MNQKKKKCGKENKPIFTSVFGCIDFLVEKNPQPVELSLQFQNEN